MKRAPWHHLDKWRFVTGTFATPRGANFGCFLIPGPCAADLKIIVNSADLDPKYPWDHVSVSCKNRCPNWPEMSFIKDLFFDEEECAFQFHPPKSQYINNHPYCLHIWKPAKVEIPMPPSIMVGAKCLTGHSPAEKDGVKVCQECGINL